MGDQKKSNRWILWFAATILLFAPIIIVLNFLTSAESSQEWIYTVGWINKISVPVLLILSIILIAALIRKLGMSRRGRWILFLICLFFFAVPFFAPPAQLLAWPYQYLLSTCWACALILFGLLLFMIAARFSAAISLALCTLASVVLALGIMEVTLLFSSQAGDGVSDLSAQSKYAAKVQGMPQYASWIETACGKMPTTPGADTFSYHREAKFDYDLYDVLYRFNTRGHRKLPGPASSPENGLILFGCSFTFGHGLENEQTWAWKLANLLGPAWQLENYAGNGYSPYHMLCLLEHGLVAPLDGKHRYALYLAIEDHLRRNDFFPNTPHYQLTENGEAIRKGVQKFVWIYNLPQTINGSQLAREVATFIRRTWIQPKDELLSLYLATVRQSARLLEKNYGARLIVLLWPDFEYIKGQLEQAGIAVLLARDMLPDWNQDEKDPGSVYRINRLYEGHPNDDATTLLAEGLARYFLSLTRNGATLSSSNQ